MEVLRSKKFRINDYLMIAVLVFAAAIIAFTYLGSTEIPVTAVPKGEFKTTIVIDSGDFEAASIWIYQGIGGLVMNVASSGQENGVYIGETINTGNKNMYRWEVYNLKEPCSRYIKISNYYTGSDLYEIALVNASGQKLAITPDESLGIMYYAFDEQSLIPDNPSLLNGMYFDELYHARTALEFINGDEPYENTHPPLGKIIISFGIRLFGMNPFGWRFMDAVFSVLLIPLFYIFIFLLTKSTAWSTFGASLFIMDGMRIVMGRIATLDTFAVFFTLLAFMLMYLFYTNFREGVKAYKWVLPLAGSGIIWGVACAVKWTGVYAGAALFIIFIIAVVKWLVEYSAVSSKKRLILDSKVILRLISLFGLCVVFFIAVPIIIYLLSYIPYKAGMDTTDSLFKVMWDNQLQMYNYHSGLTADHPYGSPWYMWLINLKSVYFYNGEDYLAAGGSAKIFAFGNYAIWLTGLLVVIERLFFIIKRLFEYFVKGIEFEKGAWQGVRDDVFLLVCYFAMLVPWMFITRVAFLYHYYTCVPILIAITVLYLKRGFNQGLFPVKENSKMRYLPFVIHNGTYIKGRTNVVFYLIIVILVFIICYPLYTGIPIDWPIFNF